MNPITRKTIAITGLSAAGLGLIGFLAWLFNGLDALPKAINLDALPEGWVVTISFFAMVVGGMSGLFNLFPSEPPTVPIEPVEPAPEDGG